MRLSNLKTRFDDKLNNDFGLLSCCGGHQRELKGMGSLNPAAYLCQTLSKRPLESNEVPWDHRAFSGPQCCNGEEAGSSC